MEPTRISCIIFSRNSIPSPLFCLLCHIVLIKADFLLVIFIRRPSNLDSDQFKLAILFDSFSCHQEGKVIWNAIVILTACEVDEFGSFLAETERVDLLNFVTLLNLRSWHDLSLLNLHQMKLPQMLWSTHTDLLLLTIFCWNFGSVFLNKLCFAFALIENEL